MRIAKRNIGTWFIAAAIITATSGFAEERIPLESFFSQQNFISPALSPKGDKIAFIAQIGDHQVIGIRSLDNPKPKLIRRNSNPDYYWYNIEWANDERLLVSAQTLYRPAQGLNKVRYRATRLTGMDIDSTKDTNLGKKWPRAGFNPVQFQDQIVDLLPDDPKNILVQVRQLDDRFSAIHRMNVRTGKIRQIGKAVSGVMDYFVDGAGEIRAGKGLIDGFVARTSQDDEFSIYAIKRTHDDEAHLSFSGFDADPNIVWVYDNVNGFTVLRQLDLSTRKLVGPARGADGYDVANSIFHPVTKNVVGYTYTDDAPQGIYLDADAEALMVPIQDALPGSSTSMIDISLDGNKAIVLNSGDTMPPHYYFYDRSSGKPEMQALGRAYPKLAVDKLATTKVVRYTTTDDVEITGYLTIPNGSDGKSLPTVIMPHGGPVARDYLRWDPEVQFLANRGYAVFRMNFRGSSGYGKEFRDTAWEAWGRRMQDDITDGTHWLVEQGIADENRIAIVGASYGGYAALMGAVRTPDLYQAIVSYVGVSYLPWIEREFASSVNLSKEIFNKLSLAEKKDRSPSEHAESFDVPVLLGHGELDGRVNVRHSRHMAKRLEDAGKDVQYLEFKDEIHGFLLEDNRLHWYSTLEKFLDKHIGERSIADKIASR